MKPIFIFDCGCRLPIEKTKIDHTKTGKKTYIRMCKEHGGGLLYKIAKCKNGHTLKLEKQCWRIKCPECGILVTISNGAVRPNKKKVKVDRVHDCMYCDKPINSNNDDGLCTFHHKEENEDNFDSILFDRFVCKVMELR